MVFKDFASYWQWARDVIERRLDRDVKKLHYSNYMHHMLEGGKRIRGTLCLLVSQALGGGVKKTLPYAVAVEFCHAATLAHDDFIDYHETRRGRVPLYKILDPRRAVILADMLLSTATHRIALRSTDGYRTISKAIYELCRGVALEPLNPVAFMKDVASGKTRDRFYLSLIRLKTAELFAAATKLGAIAARANQTQRLQAYNYGVAVGEAYQVADDIVDISNARKTKNIDRVTAVKLFPAMMYLSREAIGDMVRDVLSGSPSVKTIEKVSISGLEDLIKMKAREAKEAIKPFPDNSYKKLLTNTPKAVVNIMLKEVGKG